MIINSRKNITKTLPVSYDFKIDDFVNGLNEEGENFKKKKKKKGKKKGKDVLKFVV